MESEPMQGLEDGHAEMPALDALNGPVVHDDEVPDAALVKGVSHTIGLIEEAGHCAPELLAQLHLPSRPQTAECATDVIEEAGRCYPDMMAQVLAPYRTQKLELIGEAPVSVDQKEAAAQTDQPELGPVDLRPTDILACSFSLDQKLALETLVEQHPEVVAPGHTAARACLRLDAATFEPLPNSATPECVVQVTLTADGAVSLLGAEDMAHLERAAREVYRLLQRWGLLAPPQ